MEITVLCKVVDNFGDIGVAWRLTKQLRRNNEELNINLIVDDLSAFSKIDSRIRENIPLQIINNIKIYDWKNFDYCYKEFFENDGEKLFVILELFQCGRPDWMEKILFEDKLNHVVYDIMIDYLTAEKYAEDFHGLQSLTRSAKVQKVNFMPGFTEKTGSLVIDQAWEKLPVWNENGSILIFTYERNWLPLTNILKKIYAGKKAVMVAQGRGCESFCSAWNESEGDCKLQILDYLDQEQWDEMMQNCFAMVIRGEESMSRACLGGIPFVWHAYPQSDEYQLVKVNALLNRMERHFKPEDFQIVKKLWISINSPESEAEDTNLEKYFNLFFENVNNLVYGFKDFALDLRKNGDLCANLMTFIKKVTIIKE